MAQRSLLFVPALVILLLVCARTRAEETSMVPKSVADTRQPLPLPAMMAEHQKQNMREHLATTMALDFHHTADTVGDAARRGDRAGVLSALDRTLRTCVSCHAAYRQDVVDEDRSKKLTAGAASH